MPRLTNSGINRKHLIIVLIALILAMGFLLIRAKRAEAALCGVASDPGTHQVSTRTGGESDRLATSLCDGTALVAPNAEETSVISSSAMLVRDDGTVSPVNADRLLAQISSEEYADALTLERLLLLGMIGLVVLTWLYLKWRPPNEPEDERQVNPDRE